LHDEGLISLEWLSESLDLINVLLDLRGLEKEVIQSALMIDGFDFGER